MITVTGLHRIMFRTFSSAPELAVIAGRCKVTPQRRQRRAVNALIADGFPSEDVSVLMPDQKSTRELAHHKETKAPEGVTAGATTGGVLGGTLGVLVGLGTLAIPGLGPLLAAGPIVAGLAGLGAGGAVGGFIGALVGMGIPEYEARRYEGRVRDGGVLLSVHCETPGEILRAKEILQDTGAADIATSAESAGAAAGGSEDEARAERPALKLFAPKDSRVFSRSEAQSALPRRA